MTCFLHWVSVSLAEDVYRAINELDGWKLFPLCLEIKWSRIWLVQLRSSVSVSWIWIQKTKASLRQDKYLYGGAIFPGKTFKSAWQWSTQEQPITTSLWFSVLNLQSYITLTGNDSSERTWGGKDKMETLSTPLPQPQFNRISRVLHL